MPKRSSDVLMNTSSEEEESPVDAAARSRNARRTAKKARRARPAVITVGDNTSSEEEEEASSVDAVTRNYRRALKADKRKKEKRTQAAVTFQRRFRGLRGRRTAAQIRSAAEEAEAARLRPTGRAAQNALRLKFFEQKKGGRTRRLKR